MECFVCSKSGSLYREEGTGRFFCGEECQRIDAGFDDLSIVPLVEVLLNTPPEDLANLCAASRKTRYACQSTVFKERYISRWLDKWQGVIDRALDDEKWDFLGNWLGFTLERPDAWKPLRYYDMNVEGVLTYLAWKGQTNLIAALLASGQIDAGSGGNQRALGYAVESDHVETVRMLISDNRFTFLWWDDDETLLHLVFDRVDINVEMATLVLESPRFDPTDGDELESSYLEAFQTALRQERLDLVDLLMRVYPAKMDLSLVFSGLINNEMGHLICTAMFEYLLSFQQFTYRVDLFLLAVENARLNMVKAFLSLPECDPTAQENAAAHLAFEERDLDMMRLLMKNDLVYQQVHQILWEQAENEWLLPLKRVLGKIYDSRN
jgi:hypothetical protein